MSTQLKTLVLVIAIALMLVSPSVMMAAHTGPLVMPTSYPGNFVSSDDQQVCFDMAALGLIGPVTEDMHGLKIDPPVNFENDHIKITISADGKSLAWETKGGATVVAFIIKGGPNYNVYDYVGVVTDHDNNLQSPQNGKNIPAISHYNVCYQVPAGDLQGCTPGYWRNHADRWVGVAPADDFDETFGVNLFDPNITLGQAIQLGGGGNNALARHGTAALLNAYASDLGSNGQFVNYPYTVTEVIALVQAGNKDDLEAANELGCPLSGTPAVPVS